MPVDKKKIKKEEIRIDNKIPVPASRFYHLIDKLSRVDDLLEILIKQTSVMIEKLDIIAGILPLPPPPPPPPIPAPLPVEVIKAAIPEKAAVEYTENTPWIEEKILTDANTDYIVNIKDALGRNAHHGWVKAKSTNSGIVKFKISPDGYHYTTNWHEDFKAGDSFDLEGMDVDTIKFRSDTAGDGVIVCAW